MIYKSILIPILVVMWQLGWWWYTLRCMTLPFTIILNLINLLLLCHSFATLLKACLSTSLQISSIQNYILARGAWDRVLLLISVSSVSIYIYMEWSGNIRDHKLWTSVLQISFASQNTVFPYLTTLTSTVVTIFF